MFKFASKASVALSSAIVATACFAQSGPPSGSLVPLDENRFDILKKVIEVPKTNVLHRQTRNQFEREVYRVPSREFVFVTNETMEVNSRPVEKKGWALVEPQAVSPQAPWLYKTK